MRHRQPVCTIEQTAGSATRYREGMNLQRIKLTISALWILAALSVILVAGASIAATVFIAALGTLPPIALLLLWREPLPTMSERIRNAQR